MTLRRHRGVHIKHANMLGMGKRTYMRSGTGWGANAGRAVVLPWLGLLPWVAPLPHLLGALRPTPLGVGPDT